MRNTWFVSGGFLILLALAPAPGAEIHAVFILPGIPRVDSRAPRDQSPPPARDPASPAPFEIVDQHLYEARQAVYAGRYKTAARRAQNALEIEPENVTALEILGSAFYLMDRRSRALSIWRKVLEIDPANQPVRSFIQLISENGPVIKI